LEILLLDPIGPNATHGWTQPGNPCTFLTDILTAIYKKLPDSHTKCTLPKFNHVMNLHVNR